MPAKTGTTPRTIDEYLSALPRDQRSALEALRRTIRAAAPDAEECISYRLAAFRRDGMLVAMGATGHHCAFYLMSGTTLDGFRNELRGYDVSKGTIRFQPEAPLPATLVRKLVKARIAENAARPAGAAPRDRSATGGPPSRSIEPAAGPTRQAAARRPGPPR